MMWLAAAMLFLQTAQQVRTADTSFRAGYAAMSAGDLTRADAEFAKVVRLTPNVAAGHSAYGAVLLAEGKTAAAIRELETAHRLDISDATATENLAVAYSTVARYAESVAAFRSLGDQLTLAPEQETAYARALVGAGDVAGAEARLRAANVATPDSAPLHDTLGVVLAQQGRYPEAELEFKRALALDAQMSAAHGHLAAALMARGDAAAAVAEWEAASKLAPSDTNILVQFGRAQMAVHDDEAATATLQHAHQLAPGDIDATYQLALALQNTGRSKEALPLFAVTVAARPNESAALTNYGLAMVQTGDALHAVPLYQRVLAVDPGNPTLREDLGVAFLQQSDLDHAIGEFRAGLALPNEGAPLSANLHYDLGLALKLKDNIPEATAEFERAAALDPSLPDPPFTLGILYMQTGQFPEAATQMERAVALQPGNGEAWSLLGNIYKQAEQPMKAIAALRRAIPLLAGQPSPHITLAALLAQQGDREGAAAERKIGAELSRVAVSRQRAEFALKSGVALLQQGKTMEALAQLRFAVAADPAWAEAHRVLSEALAKQGNAAEAALERRKAEGQP